MRHSDVVRALEQIKLHGEHDAERLVEALDRDKERQKEATKRRLKRRQSRRALKRGNVDLARQLEEEVQEEEREAQRRAQARARGRRQSHSERTLQEIQAEGRRHEKELIQAISHEKERQKKKMQKALKKKQTKLDLHAASRKKKKKKMVAKVRLKCDGKNCGRNLSDNETVFTDTGGRDFCAECRAHLPEEIRARLRQATVGQRLAAVENMGKWSHVGVG